MEMYTNMSSFETYSYLCVYTLKAMKEYCCHFILFLWKAKDNILSCLLHIHITYMRDTQPYYIILFYTIILGLGYMLYTYTLCHFII